LFDRFRPSRLSSGILGCLALAFFWLGNWQLDRAAQKAGLQQSFNEAPAFASLPADAAAVRYARVDVTGRFDPQRHVLVDNRVFFGRAGVHVLTPFRLNDGRTVLVNRGWLPLPPDRRSLPQIPTSREPTTVPAILDRMNLPGRRLGGPDQLVTDSWPQLVTYPDMDDIAAALGVELYPYVLLLDPEHPAGFQDRDWKPVQTGANKHRARALQWFTFLAAAVIIWLVLGLQRGARACR
jgi:surfeit locus 1 family protein